MFGPLFDFLTDYFYFRFYRLFMRITGSRPVAVIGAGLIAFVLGIVLLLGLYMVLRMVVSPKPMV